VALDREPVLHPDDSLADGLCGAKGSAAAGG
jgi:hypothetical protein